MVYFVIITIYPLFIIQFWLPNFTVYAKFSVGVWDQILEFWFEKVGSRQNNNIDCIECGLHSNILLSCGMTYVYHLVASYYKLFNHRSVSC